MRTIPLRAFAIGLLALIALAANAVAQTATPVLNKVELQKLIAGGSPAENARLSAHFAALADRYTAEAKRHKAMSRAFAGNVNRQLATGSSAHCTRLVELNTQSAVTVRELAAHHNRLAAGAPSIAPRDAARFQGGEGASIPTEKELNQLAANASTPADHRALLEYFVETAKRYAADVDEHVAMAQAYRGTKIAAAAAHCDRMVRLSRDAAREANAAAVMHKDLAGIAR